MIESIISRIPDEKLEEKEETVLIKKLYQEVETCAKTIPKMSNSVLSLIINSTNLSKMTDIIVPFLPIETNRQNEYLIEKKIKHKSKNAT